MHIGDATDGIRFDEETATYRTTHDWNEDGPVYLTVAAVVALAAGEGVTDVDPLGERIDPEALDGLFRPLREAEDRRSVDAGGNPYRRDREVDADRRGVGDGPRIAGGNLTNGVGMPAPTVDPPTVDLPTEAGSRQVGAGREEYVQFVVADCRVTVTWDGLVVATPPSER